MSGHQPSFVLGTTVRETSSKCDKIFDIINNLKSSMEENKAEKTVNGSVKYIIKYFREYCNYTTIHGVKYFGERRTIFEKIWWLAVSIISLMICMFCILNIYEKWEQSPVIVSFATRGEPIYKIPFPAVTVCLESKVIPSVFNYADVLIKKHKGQNLTEEEEKTFGTLSYVCNDRHSVNYSTLNSFTNEDFLEILEKISPKFSIINCRYLGKPWLCRSLFTKIITDDGFCYTFNLLDRNELFQENIVHYSDYHKIGLSSANWSMQYGYKSNALIPYPKRALLAGSRYSLKFDLQSSAEKPDAMCRNSVQGYKILFHSPTRLPRLSQQFVRIPLNKVFSAAIRPSQMMTSDAVKNYSAKKRRCYFASEKKLKYFKVYSQSNCNLECLTNFTLHRCECVVFFMPRENGTRICNAADYECTVEAEYKVQTLNLYKKIVLKDTRRFNSKTCDCLPICSDIDYKIGSSQANWDWSTEIENGLHLINDDDELACIMNTTNSTNSAQCSVNQTTTFNPKHYHLSQVNAYFISSYFIGYVRNELYGPIDFLANFGGLLGLFTGFSILSLMEIIYFLSVRLICNKYLYGRWTGV